MLAANLPVKRISSRLAPEHFRDARIAEVSCGGPARFRGSSGLNYIASEIDVNRNDFTLIAGISMRKSS